MAHAVFLVLDKVEQSPEVLDAWHEAGVSGATMLESTGLARMRGMVRDDIPLLPSIEDVLGTRELHHRTLFTVVEDDATLERVIAATERVVGDFAGHHTGLLFVMPVSRVLGLRKKGRDER